MLRCGLPEPQGDQGLALPVRPFAALSKQNSSRLANSAACAGYYDDLAFDPRHDVLLCTFPKLLGSIRSQSTAIALNAECLGVHRTC